MIDLIPDLKKNPIIYKSHKEGNLIVFVGAGLSELWGCKRWGCMAESMIGSCYEDSEISLNYWAKDMLLKKYGSQPRKLITIAKQMLGAKYIESLRKTILPIESKKNKFPKLFENLSGWNATFITTNIDSLLSADLFDKKKVHVDCKLFDKSLLKPGNIFHLHGHIDSEESLVMTIDEYVKRYKVDEVTQFLKDVFIGENYCLLFVGYSISEMEIIDYMIEKYSNETKDLYNRYFVLLPFFNNEEDLFKHEVAYFQQININALPYSMDERGYDQLYNVIEKWGEELLSTQDEDEYYKFTQLLEKNA